ncbi:MAG: cation-transporting P-type ATPase, partial [Verrucomicrobiae bacterium]|nr:cation-transporting P-type ATPase [Verrucomicrobiae bacterium]
MNPSADADPGSDAFRPWAMPVEAVRETLRTDPESGLDEGEARRRLERHGPNRVETIARPSPWRILLRQFRGLIVALLGAAAVLSFFMGDRLEGHAVLAVLGINAAIGFSIEWHAARSMDALRRLARTRVRVTRGGVAAGIDAENLVPGDLVLLEAGDLVPADLRLAEGAGLEVDESALTG